MPRPPVSRPARTRPMKATNPDTAPAPAPTSAPAHALETKAKENGSSSDIYDVSDREKERAAARRKSLRDGTSTRTRTIPAESIQSQKALDRAKERRDAAMERLQNITSTDSSDDGEDESEKVIPGTIGSPGPSQRVKATPLRNRPTDPSGLDLDDSMFDNLDTTIGTTPGHGSAHRSADTSTLSVSQFRRRPRAGSFLSRDDGPIRPSSRAGPNTPAFSSTLNFGVFKRRAREPSILSTAQKPRPQRPGPEQDSENDEEEGEGLEEDGFAPEAESTPLRRSKRGSGGAEPTQPTSSAKSRKRKSTESHRQRVRSSPFEVNDDVRQSIEQPASDEDSPLSSPPPLLPRHEPSTPIAPSMDPELMAPPLSSDSSESEEEIWPPLRSIPKARTRQAASALPQTPARGDDASDMSSPPSLTHSPNYAHSSSPPPARVTKPKRKVAAKPVRKLTTADLTGLLPRRRRRGGGDDVFDIDEDESDAEVEIPGLGDEDELEHDVRTRRRPASRANAQNQAAIKARALARNKDKLTQGSNKRISMTYGRLSDKENNDQEEEEDGNDGNNSIADLGEEDSQASAGGMGDELKNAVIKFQEVDQWELSFEERTRSSSPIDAR
ncbi:hypothetical protein GGR51DRAFT_137871 [Nemania sp. FL0031]|nr:hypothetical protein GGR51DRAFT_137871 [Nemania sp. FL0031]